MAAVEKLNEGLEVRDPDRVVKMDVYLPLILFTDDNRDALGVFIDTINEEFVDTGKLQWATQRQVYEAYLEWNP